MNKIEKDWRTKVKDQERIIEELRDKLTRKENELEVTNKQRKIFFNKYVKSECMVKDMRNALIILGVTNLILLAITIYSQIN